MALRPTPPTMLMKWDHILWGCFPPDVLLLLCLDFQRLTEFPDGQISELVAKIANCC